jgi:hypothetical protein
MISDPEELYRFLATPGIEVENLIFSSDQVVWASWRYIDEKIPSLRRKTKLSELSFIQKRKLRGTEMAALYISSGPEDKI